jgi:uncharacterized protein involved in exopolysaccharide biosynthesis
MCRAGPIGSGCKHSMSTETQPVISWPPTEHAPAALPKANMRQPAEHLTPSDADDTLDLLDLLVVFTENLKLLIFGPILIGLLAWAVSFALPHRYESESWLQLDDKIAEVSVARLTSADVLIPLLSQTPWITDWHSDPEDAMEQLRDDIDASYSKADGLVKLRVQAPSPEQARDLNTALVEALRVFSLPRGKEMELLQQQAKFAEASVNELTTVLERLGRNMAPEAEGDNVARAYIGLFEQRALRAENLQKLQRTLEGFGDEVFAQSPSLPKKPSKPNKPLIAWTSGLIGSLVLLLFVYFRQGWRDAACHEISAHKIQRIRRSLGIRNP